MNEGLIATLPAGQQQAPGHFWSGEHIYWLFSSAAQCVSTCIAVLLTGYAIVITMMESARQKDDSLSEIHHALRSECHARLRLLALVTGGAITMNLLCVFFNEWAMDWAVWLVMATSAIDLVVVFWCLMFVLTIVDPKKYEKLAGKVLRKLQSAHHAKGEPASAAEFFNEFRVLERSVVELLRVTRQYEPGAIGDGGHLLLSFREMVDLLIMTELISAADGKDLLELNKYRNLVFHGHVDEAERAMIEKTIAARTRITSALRQYT